MYLYIKRFSNLYKSCIGVVIGTLTGIFGKRACKCKLVHFLPIFVLAICTTLLSCSKHREHQIASVEDALNEYHSFYKNIANNKSYTIDDISDLICQWIELGNTVIRHIETQQVSSAHTMIETDFCATTDSIRYHFVTILSSKTRSLTDVIKIKDKTSDKTDVAKGTVAFVRAYTFFALQDSVPVRHSGKDTAIHNYRKLLHDMRDIEFKSDTELYSFLAEEESCFRDFLCSLHQYCDTSLTDITEDTRTICNNIIIAANEKRLNQDEVLALMTMRTNRRLVFNAMTCMADIQYGRIKSPTQYTAYCWMILQPFISIDRFSMALLTEGQKEQLYEIAAHFSDMVGNHEEDIDKAFMFKHDIPIQILNLYITSL